MLGTLAFYGRRPRQPSPEHIELLGEWARVAGIAIERHRTLEQLVHDARHDGLTGLPNRTAIFEVLEDAIVRARPRSQVAVLFIDLDGLKSLNDTLGHDRADEMLREIADRLSESIRGEDIVGRFGGDEFVVIAEGVGTQVAAGELAVNVSAVQLSNPDFAHWVEQTVAHAEFASDFLALEITETALMRPTATTSRNIQHLAARGIRIVLDDFGGSRAS